MRLKGQRVNPKTRTASSRAVAWGERTHNARRYATCPAALRVVQGEFRRDPARLGAATFAPRITFDAQISRKTLRGPPKAECLQGETDGDAVPGGNGRLALMARSVG